MAFSEDEDVKSDFINLGYSYTQPVPLIDKNDGPGCADKYIKTAKTSRNYLTSNATSHPQIFHAFAELIDNAYDPDVAAKMLCIDVEDRHGTKCLVFSDTGKGLDLQTMDLMLSFGFSNKETVDGHEPIGMYGNGFKSGSMRIGKDALVLSLKNGVTCCGLLSQTYLEATKAEVVRVPIVQHAMKRRTDGSQGPPTLIMFSDNKDHHEAFKLILQYSPFKTMKEIRDEIVKIADPNDKYAKKSGTRIFIWNLKEDDKLDTDSYSNDIHDLRCPEDAPMYKRSLLEYCSILYLKPRMNIYIKGEKVKAQMVIDTLLQKDRMLDYYKPMNPNGANSQMLNSDQKHPITFGFFKKRNAYNDYGVMFYHKNRLIKFEKVGCQKTGVKQGTEEIPGTGVVAIMECNHLAPSHNKQDFNYDEKYSKTISALSRKIKEYWDSVKGHNVHKMTEEDIAKLDERTNWVQCDSCMKWRRLPEGVTVDEDEQWDCSMHPNKIDCTTIEEMRAHDIDIGRVQVVRSNQKKSAARKKKATANGTGSDAEELRIKEEQLSQWEEDLTRRERNLSPSPSVAAGPEGLDVSDDASSVASSIPRRESRARTMAANRQVESALGGETSTPVVQRSQLVLPQSDVTSEINVVSDDDNNNDTRSSILDAKSARKQRLQQQRIEQREQLLNQLESRQSHLVTQMSQDISQTIQSSGREDEVVQCMVCEKFRPIPSRPIADRSKWRCSDHGEKKFTCIPISRKRNVSEVSSNASNTPEMAPRPEKRSRRIRQPNFNVSQFIDGEAEEVDDPESQSTLRSNDDDEIVDNDEEVQVVESPYDRQARELRSLQEYIANLKEICQSMPIKKEKATASAQTDDCDLSMNQTTTTTSSGGDSPPYAQKNKENVGFDHLAENYKSLKEDHSKLLELTSRVTAFLTRKAQPAHLDSATVIKDLSRFVEANKEKINARLAATQSQERR